MTEQDPHGLSPATPGAKLDGGKSPIVSGLLQHFPLACAEVARVTEFGARKYSWHGWSSVPNGIQRYTDALGRHLAEIDGPVDADSHFLHAAQVAWNALARLELMLRAEADASE
ncbi:MAG: dATP/dGTP diphosphohydrolase domain-containing protein [Gammaproteobacteria bacterium]